MRSQAKFLIPMTIAAVLLSACSTTSTGRSQLVLKSDAALAQEG